MTAWPLCKAIDNCWNMKVDSLSSQVIIIVIITIIVTDYYTKTETDKVRIWQVSVDSIDNTMSQHIDELVSCRRVIVRHKTEQVSHVTAQASRSTTQVVVNQLTYHPLHDNTQCCLQNHHLELCVPKWPWYRSAIKHTILTTALVRTWLHWSIDFVVHTWIADREG